MPPTPLPPPPTMRLHIEPKWLVALRIFSSRGDFPFLTVLLLRQKPREESNAPEHLRFECPVSLTQRHHKLRQVSNTNLGKSQTQNTSSLKHKRRQKSQTQTTSKVSNTNDVKSLKDKLRQVSNTKYVKSQAQTTPKVSNTNERFNPVHRGRTANRL